MKIGLVCPYNMFEHAGGVMQVVLNLREGLIKKGHKVKIITPRPAGFRGEVPKDYILLGTSTRFNPGLGTAGAWTFDINGNEISSILEQENFDVINFHEPWAPILARQILPLSKAAHVGTFHANLADSVAAKSLVNLFLPYGRGIGEKLHLMTAVSPAPAGVLLDKDPEHRLVKNIKYIPNGVDLNYYKPFKKRIPLHGQGTKTVLYVGRLERRKSVEWLVRAFDLLVAEMPDTHLMIAGEGNRRGRLEQLVQSLVIPNVEFLGYVDDERKKHLMGNADLVCSPAMFGESFGIVLLEAMAMGTPVVAGANNGYSSVLTGFGRLGLVDAKATADFSNRLAIFLTDDFIRKQWRSWALKEVKKYDYVKVIDQYEAAYKEAVGILAAAKSAKSSKVENGRSVKKIISRLFVRRHAR